MSDVIKKLHASAALVKQLGQTQLPNSRTLSEMLTFDGISLWEVVAPVLAAISFPKELSGNPPPFILRLFKPYLSLAKNKMKTVFSVSDKLYAKDSISLPTEPGVFFLGFSGYMYRDILDPVALRLSKNYQMDYFVIHDEGRLNKSTSKIHNHHFRSIWRYKNHQVVTDEFKLKQKLDLISNYLLSKNALPALDLSSHKISWSHLEINIKFLLKVYLPSLLPYFALTRYILEKHPPSIIVSPDVADPRTRLFCLVGHSMGIPSLDIQFGMYSESSVEWQFFLSDRVAVWGDKARKVFVGHGIPQERITITGSARYDDMAEVSDNQTILTRKRLGIPHGNTMVLFASLYSLKHYSKFNDFHNVLKKVKRTIFKVAHLNNGLSLVVKPHPFENVRDTKRLASGFQNIIFVDPQEDIRELINVCDVFITLGSTTTMDALLAHKLVIFPDSPGLVWWDDMYLKNNVCLVPKSEDEFSRQLKMVVNGQKEILMKDLEPARQHFLQEWVYRVDGHAATRIASLIMEMANNSGKRNPRNNC